MKSIQYFDNSIVYEKRSKQKQMCWHLQLFGNDAKFIKVKSYIQKTK